MDHPRGRGDVDPDRARLDRLAIAARRPRTIPPSHRSVLLVTVAIVSIGGSLLIELLMASTKRPPFLVDQLRGAKYLYLPIFVLCGHGFVALLRARRRAIAALFLLLLQVSAPIHLPDKPDFGLDTLLRETRLPGREEIPWLETPVPIPGGHSRSGRLGAARRRRRTRSSTAATSCFVIARLGGSRSRSRTGGFSSTRTVPASRSGTGGCWTSIARDRAGNLVPQATLARDYGADYLIVRPTAVRNGLPLRVAYENGSYRVYDLGRSDP